MDKFAQLRKTIDEMETKSLVASEMKAFVTLVLKIVNETKDELANTSKENIATIQDAVKYIEQEHEKAESNVSQVTESAKKDFDNSLKELKDLIAQVKTIKPIDGVDGKDADEEKIVEDVLAKIKLPEYEVYSLEEKGEDIINEINALPLEDEYKIDASHIKNLPESKGNFNGGGWRNLYQMHDVELSSPTDNQVLTYDSASNTWKNETPSGGSVGPGTINELAYFDTTTSIASLATATYPSLTELSYVKGVTSSIQTQLNGKASTTAYTLAGVSTLSTDATKSLYTMTSTIPVEFRRSAGSTLLYLDETNGRVGIGGTPTTQLEVLHASAAEIQASSTAGSMGLTYKSTLGGTYTWKYWFDRVNTLGLKWDYNGSTMMSLSQTGALTIAGALSFSGDLSLGSNKITGSNSSYLNIYDPGTGFFTLRATTVSTSISRIIFQTGTSPTTRMTVDGDGNVIIGTTATGSARLHVRSDGTNDVGRFENSAGTAGFKFNTSGNIVPITANQSTESITAGYSGGFNLGGSTGSWKVSSASGSYDASSLTLLSGYGDGFRMQTATNTSTSGLRFNLALIQTFAAAAGSANYRPLIVQYTINNSGAQSGTATGIYLRGTETALNGMTHNLMDLGTTAGGSMALITNAGEATFASSITTLSTLELGHATDTTFSRVSAGVASIEGARIITSTGTTANTILKNNGTTFVASTETYAAPGTSGNVMTSDGTNWTSTTPAGSSTAVDSAQSVYSNHEIVFSGSGATPTGDTWDFDGTLNSATRWNGNMIRMTSGTNTTITQFLPGNIGASSAFFQFGNGKDIIISFNAKFSSVTGQVGVGVADNTSTFYDVTTSAGKIMFTFDGTTLNAVNGEAGTNTTTDISSGLTLTNWNSFKIVYTYGTDIKFYVNNTLKATHTTNRPTSSNNARFGMGAATTGKTYEVSNVVISTEK